MFPKETPPPNQYTRRNTRPKHYPVLQEEPKSRTTKIVAWGIILIGVLFILGIFIFSPREKPLVCSPMPLGLSSLITFGTCKEE